MRGANPSSLNLPTTHYIESMRTARYLAVFGACLLLCGSSVARADQIDRLVQEGIDHLYSVRFDAAAKSFDAAILVDGSDPRGYFFRSSVHLWSYVFDQRPEQLDQFLRMTEKTIRVASARDDSRSRLFLGMSYGYKAIANARAENITAAALSGKTCYEKLDALVRDDPSVYDAYLGLGIFHFLFGSVPKAAQFLGSMSGIKGDARLGLKEIETTARRGSYFRNDAQLLHALLTIYYNNDLAGGTRTMETMSSRYPGNVALAYALGSAYFLQGLPGKSIPYFKRVSAAGNSDFRLLSDLSRARLGQAYFQINDFNNARESFQAYLRLTKEKTFVATAWYHLGLCFEMAGNRANGVRAYERARTSPVEAPEDFAARRRAGLLIRTPLSKTDILLIQGLNNLGAGDFDRALLQGVEALKRKPLSGTQEAQIYYIFGRVFGAKGSWQKSIDAFRLAVGAKGNQESWIDPWSYYYMAECYLKLGDRERWKRSLALAKNFGGYDQEPQLRFLIERDVTLID